ncbi:DUF262 domain-containing protein [Streptomyces sp.]|uniref:DUF262 domain-containing protein n=1 Tax=Streptomyces sp. TaxID=1931 RepID=UPI002811BFC2|nr:DUF262 domain-containing protein [Streptomyces sp.]
MTSDAPAVDEDEVNTWFEDESDEEFQEPSASAAAPSPTDPAEKYAKSQLRVVRETKDYALDYLRHALQPGRELIDISPAYQRRLRWTNKKKSLLIESFLLNIPVPPIFLFERDYNAYEVIDGRQRLDAVSTFLANEYALSGLEYWPELNRKRFTDLPQILQRGLLRRSLPAVVLLAETHSSGEEEIDVRRVLFDRLNTGGIQLNPQELRNALYPGALNALLIRLARSAPFTQAWGIPPYTPGEEAEPSEHLLGNPIYASLADAELVLRFFALRDALESDKRGSLRRILDRYMAANASIDPASADRMESEYIDLLGRLVDLFNGDPFRLPTTGRPSRPLYDALMIALSRNRSMELDEHAVREALRSALAEPAVYDVLVGRGNTIGAIKDRVDSAESILRSTQA